MSAPAVAHRPRKRQALLAAFMVALPVTYVALAPRLRSSHTGPVAGTPPITLLRTRLVGEPDERDQLRTSAVRVWSRPSLNGMWCRIPKDVEVSVVAIDRTPALVFEVVSEDGRCRGWVDAGLTTAGPDIDR